MSFCAFIPVANKAAIQNNPIFFIMV